MTVISSAMAVAGAIANALGGSSDTPAQAATTTDKATLHKAAQGFESILVRQMLSTARQTNFGDTLWGDDQGNDTFNGMRDDHVAEVVSQTGTLGLAQQIERQLGGGTKA
jgi:peptidoglycan hydrolase FlgJ